MIDLACVVYFFVWYVFGSAANIYCKEFLRLYESPVILTLAQYFMGIIISSIIILFQQNQTPTDIFHDKPIRTRKSSFLGDISEKGQKELLFICLVNGFGHLMTNYSMNSVAVSFTHTIKAAEPLFSVILSIFILKERLSPGMYISLIPIVFGIILATTTELSYTHMGMITAMLSNAMFSSRNTFSKKIQNEKINNFHLFWYLSVSGAFLMFILLILSTILGFSVEPIDSAWKSLFFACLFHSIYNISSFMILSKVAPVTHAIGNAMRRLFIIYCSVIWFRTPITLFNFIGTLAACGGVFWYSRASQLQKQNTNRYQKKQEDFLNL